MALSNCLGHVETATTNINGLASERPLFKFGLLTDIQHSDKDTVSFDGRPQRYQESAGKLQAALAHLSQMTQQQDQPMQPLSFLLTLGDIVDGYGGDSCSAAAKASKDLKHVVGLISDGLQDDVPARHVLGNHCLAAQRSELLQELGMPGSYYSVPLAAKWKLIVLDTTEMSLHSGYPQDSSQMQQAHQWLESHPKEQYPNAESWNGGLSSAQMTWLQLELAEASLADQQVIVACHHPLAPGSAPAEYLAWNNNAVLELLEQHAGTVRLVFSGHYHPGGYAERNGIHYVVLEGILEAPSDSNAYALVEVWSSKAVIHGYGVATSRELLFN